MFDTIKDTHDVLWVIDDRDQVVNMWRNDLGLPTLQVADGDVLVTKGNVVLGANSTQAGNLTLWDGFRLIATSVLGNAASVSAC